jgi:hypothetical protein
MKYFPSLLVLLAVSTPFAVSAATYAPNCAVLTKTSSGQFWPMINHQLYLIQSPGDPLTIIWGGANATSAHDQAGTTIPFAGQQIVAPTQTTTYTYTFIGNGQTTCSVTTVVFGSRGVLQGSSDSTVTTTTPTQQTNTTTVTNTSMSNGVDAPPSNASFSVSEIPLLSGGYAVPGSTIPVQYVKLVNTSSETTTLPGIWLQQDGSAPVSSIIGFSFVDDKATLRGGTGGTEGVTPFQNGLAFIPLDATFAPGQFRIFTIKALVSKNISASYGSTLMIDVAKIDTKGLVAASIPVRGTTWTLRAF